MNVRNGFFDTQGIVFLEEAQATKLDNAAVDGSDVLLNITGASVARVCLAPEEMEGARVNQHVMILRPIQERISSSYLCRFLASPKMQDFLLREARAGATREALTKDKIGKLTIPLPPLGEQGRIAEILDLADGLRVKRREALAEVEGLTEAVFLEMFGDFASGKSRFPLETLGKLIKVTSGKFLRGSDQSPEGTFPVYGGNGVNGYHSDFMFEERKVVLGRVGAYCGVVHYTHPNSWITDNALYVQSKLRDINDIFLLHLLQLADLNQYAGRSAQPLISGERIYRVEVPLPPLQLQQKFAERVEAIEKLKASHQRSLEEMDALFASLQSRAFKGEL